MKWPVPYSLRHQEVEMEQQFLRHVSLWWFDDLNENKTNAIYMSSSSQAKCLLGIITGIRNRERWTKGPPPPQQTQVWQQRAAKATCKRLVEEHLAKLEEAAPKVDVPHQQGTEGMLLVPLAGWQNSDKSCVKTHWPGHCMLPRNDRPQEPCHGIPRTKPSGP